MDENAVRLAMAESGKTKIKDLLNYMKVKYHKKYNKETAKRIAQEISDDIRKGRL